MTFENAFEQYKIYASNRHKKQGFDNICYDFNDKILRFYKNEDIYDFSKIDFINWQNKILERNYKNSYNKKLYYVFTSFLDFCCIYYNLKNNVAREVGNFKRKVETKKYDFYNLKEFKKFIQHVHHIVYKRYFETLFFAGPRPGESMAVKFTDLKNFSLDFNKNIERKGKRNLTSPKNQSSIRTVKIDKKLYKDLKNLKDYYLQKYGYFNENFFIFGGPKPLSPTSIERYKNKACEEANIRKIKLHQFRHSHATLLLQRGIMINEISRRLGHSKTSTTLNIYTHTDFIQEKRVLETLNCIRYNFFDNICYDFKKIIYLLKRKKTF